MLKRVRTVTVLNQDTGELETIQVPAVTAKTFYNAHEFKKQYEYNNGVSETIPNMAMTVKELIARFASGMPLALGKQPIFEGDAEEVQDLDTMDLIELHQYYKELKQRKQEAEERVVSARTKAEQMKMDKIVKERVEQRIKDMEEKKAKEYRDSLKPRSNEESNV